MVLTRPVWTSPTFDQEMSAIYPDIFEVRVFSHEKGEIVAAIELVSPGNKDRPAARAAFVAKCASYLHNGVGLVIVDPVGSKQFNLHNDLVQFLNGAKDCGFASGVFTYATAYRPVHGEQHDRFEIWKRELTIGETLPDLPLPLGSREYVQLELEYTYHESCLDSQIAW